MYDGTYDGRVLVIPSLDLLGGRLARLRSGEIAAVGDGPHELARRWVSEGAQWLHVVDVDGARTGRPGNLGAIGRIAALGVPLQVVGGIRDEATARQLEQAGATRIVIACGDEELLVRLAPLYRERLAVTVYVRDGMAAGSPWSPPSLGAPEAVLARASAHGVRTAIYADVAAAGTLAGPAMSRLAAAAAAFGGDLLYSGGVGSLEDVRLLAATRTLSGVVVGSALDAGRFTLPDAMRAALTPGTGAP